MSVALERALPHSLEAERAVLGAVLTDPSQLAPAQGVLGAGGAFYREAHRRIWGALLALDGRQAAIDLLTLCEELRRQGTLEDVGGPAYVASMVDGVPRVSNTEHYARLVAEKARLRHVIFAAQKLLAMAYEDDQPADVVLEHAEQLLVGLSRDQVGGEGFLAADAWMRDLFGVIERLATEQKFVTGLATGFEKLDYMTRGFQPGDMIILAGRPSMGKTSLGLQIAEHAAHAGTVGFFSIEMSRQAIGLRAVSLRARLNSYALMTGRLAASDYERLTAAMESIARSGFQVDDSGDISPGMLRSRARRLAAEHPPLTLLVVDYIGLIDPAGVAAENRTQEVAQISRKVKQLAKELQVPVLVLSQLSRANEARADKRPQLSDLRESGALEQDADVVLLIHRPEVYEQHPKEPGLAELIIAKQRNGPTGTIRLKFIGQQTRFEAWPEGGGA